MTEIKNVKRWHGQSIVTINCSCTIIGALAIFGGMALNNHNNGTKENKIANTNKIMLMKVKTKTHLKTLLKINQNLQTVINQKDDQDKATKDETNNDQNNANQANNQSTK